jgi:acyl-CoA synthetase (AMP-forming)/AMP-acid ligase II
VGPGDVTQVCEPQVHVSGFIATLTTLLAGGTVALHDGFDLDTYVTGLQAHRPTLVCTHSDLLAQLVRAPGATPTGSPHCAGSTPAATPYPRRCGPGPSNHLPDVGDGTRLFAAKGLETALELVEPRTTSKGVTILVYRNAGRPECGTAGVD